MTTYHAWAQISVVDDPGDAPESMSVSVEAVTDAEARETARAAFCEKLRSMGIVAKPVAINGSEISAILPDGREIVYNTDID